jgi:hypothetical protein
VDESGRVRQILANPRAARQQVVEWVFLSSFPEFSSLPAGPALTKARRVHLPLFRRTHMLSSVGVPAVVVLSVLFVWAAVVLSFLIAHAPEKTMSESIRGSR